MSLYGSATQLFVSIYGELVGSDGREGNDSIRSTKYLVDPLGVNGDGKGCCYFSWSECVLT